ncbi:MAG: hypothetical protein IT210_07935 [Armatimonadetes bacterium]|nr:hypothetical protein [Armatimonadota bacterium]
MKSAPQQKTVLSERPAEVADISEFIIEAPPITNPNTLYGDFWPDEEDIRTILDTLEQWREETS